MARTGRGGRELVVIYWRDIPAQVNAQEGRNRHQVVLGGKFQRAIDRAKRKAGIYTADEDVAQWRRESRPIEGELALEAQTVADAIEHEYRRDRLGLLAYYGGWEADVVSTEAIDRQVLDALEELDAEEDEQENQ
jgi:Virulence factor